jgi:hypothetical protein
MDPFIGVYRSSYHLTPASNWCQVITRSVHKTGCLKRILNRYDILNNLGINDYL